MPVWLEYVQFSIGAMEQADGMTKIRETFDRALTACGLHVTKGANLWEAYREFENAIMVGLLVSLSAIFHTFAHHLSPGYKWLVGLNVPVIKPDYT